MLATLDQIRLIQLNAKTMMQDGDVELGFVGMFIAERDKFKTLSQYQKWVDKRLSEELMSQNIDVSDQSWIQLNVTGDQLFSFSQAFGDYLDSVK